ncbi:MAG: hypothetical protein ICV66_02040 [Chitinophagaceae bacterium]|nr:hypothetical protein [Chitinophagaceae bacterium]
MKQFLLITITFCFLSFARAQQVHFIYLQTDDGSPFYVKMSDKVFRSSSSGYLILSNLKDSTYILSIGLPPQTTEAKFSIRINAVDRGFLLKNFDNELTLFDLQTLEIYKPSVEPVSEAQPRAIKSDQFTKMLSQAANDTSLLTMPVAIKEKKKEEQKEKEEQQEKKNEQGFANKDELKPETDIKIVKEEPKIERVDTTTITAASNIAKNGEQPNANTAPITEPQKDQEIAQQEDVKFVRSVVRRRSESSTTEGFGLVFFDDNGTSVDTIRLLIPAQKSSIMLAEDKKDNVQTQDDKATSQKDNVQNTLQTNTNEQQSANAVVQRNKCKAQATDKDFLRLRKNMAGKSTDEQMIAEAKKFFRTKCFTTEQTKNLSALFLTNAGKYQFFDAAFLYISDPENFPSLQSELKDEYYSNRFKALIGK